MIPLWKIRRELDTLLQQIQAIPELLIGVVRQRWLDRRRPEDFCVMNGGMPLLNKVAIFLIFQPLGMSQSIISTCRHLTAKGYSTLLICNSLLSEDERAQLEPYVWRFLTRRNFGYDFGGYRDGINYLRVAEVVPDFLIILNDSIWFPLSPSETMLQCMEHSQADFVGAIRHVDHPGIDGQFSGFFLSYFFLIKRPVLLSNIFVDFWAKYICTSNKFLTVRRGERGFSRKMFLAGLLNEGIYSRDRFLAIIAVQSCASLYLVLQYAAYTDAIFEQQRDQLLAQTKMDECWKFRVVEHIRVVCAKRNFHSSFCYGSIALLGIPFLKKNRGELQIRMREQYVRAVKAGHLPYPDAKIFEEIECSTGSVPSRLR